MKDKLQRLLDNKEMPEWCGLLEEMIGQMANYINRIGDYDLAEMYHPRIDIFTMDDFMGASKVEKIPSDWRNFAYACMKRVGL